MHREKGVGGTHHRPTIKHHGGSPIATKTKARSAVVHIESKTIGWHKQAGCLAGVWRGCRFSRQELRGWPQSLPYNPEAIQSAFASGVLRDYIDITLLQPPASIAMSWPQGPRAALETPPPPSRLSPSIQHTASPPHPSTSHG